MNDRWHPEIAARLPLLDGIGSWMDDLDADQRARQAAWDAPHGEPETGPVLVEDRRIPGPHGDIPVRVYRPASPGADRAALVWLHGGAFMFGDLDMPEADQVSRGIVARADAVVVSVDYRLALNGVHFPVPHDDVMAAFRWTRAQAEELGIDPARVAIGGGSAGGNLAAGAALHLRDLGETPWQALLAYPLVHPVLPEPSADLAECLAMTPPALTFDAQASRWINECYLGGPVETAGPYAFAGLADSLAGFPPTCIENDEFDNLRSSGEAFAVALVRDGVEVEQRCVRGVPHGHLNRIGFGPAHDTLDVFAARLRR
ncbi:MAG: alpha/beta hydrolase [Propionicimonas sp.]